MHDLEKEKHFARMPHERSKITRRCLLPCEFVLDGGGLVTTFLPKAQNICFSYISPSMVGRR